MVKLVLQHHESGMKCTEHIYIHKCCIPVQLSDQLLPVMLKHTLFHSWADGGELYNLKERTQHSHSLHSLCSKDEQHTGLQTEKSVFLAPNFAQHTIK